MLNENLMDSKDIIIAKLKLAIKEFQEYDIERKKYYSNALVELGKLKDEIDHCGEYLTQWVPAEEYRLSWQLEEMAIYPLADFILKDDGAWEDFVDFFTSEKETASGTPYIDCYDIRELFENGDV